MRTLLSKNKFWSLRGHSTVNDISGAPAFEVKGTFSLWRKKKIYDMEGNLLYIVRNKMIRFFMNSCYIYDGNKTKIARLKQKFHLLKGEFVLLGYKDEYAIDGTLGLLSERNMTITRNGEVIGEAGRKFTSAGDVLGATDSFYLTAYHDEDAAFLVALIVAIDNIIDKNTRD